MVPFELSTTTKIRILIMLTVVLALVAGMYHEEAVQQEKRYNRLEDKYVRVRGELGVEETQRLIDQSYKQE